MATCHAANTAPPLTPARMRLIRRKCFVLWISLLTVYVCASSSRRVAIAVLGAMLCADPWKCAVLSSGCTVPGCGTVGILQVTC